MDIPKKVVIAGKTWKVKCNEKVTKNLAIDGYFGRAVFAFDEINLRGDLSRETREETLLHEVVHIILSNAGITKNLLPDKGDLEAVVEAISCGLYAFLKDNDWRI